MRISTPDLHELVIAYINRHLTKWEPVGYVATSRARLINECLTSWGHRFTYDAEELFAALAAAGFSVTRHAKHGTTTIPGMLTEGRPFCDDLIVEASKQ